jgi:hypothetical protein
VENNRIVAQGQLSGEHHVLLYDLLFGIEPDLVVMERFVHRMTVGVNQDALEYIGVAKLWCQINHKEARYQTAAQAKQFWTDAKVKKIGLWKANQRHAMDAVRHALAYVMDFDDYYIRKLASTP